MERMAKRLPFAGDCDQDQSVINTTTEMTAVPTTLRAAVRVFPETKILTKDYEEFNVAVEVEGVLHNRHLLSDMTIDIIFIVDNGYMTMPFVVGSS
jgi:hypothetical protein